MIEKAFDWYRSTNLEMDSNGVKKCQQCCTEIKGKFHEENSLLFLKCCIELAIGQFKESRTSKSHLNSVISIVCKHLPTVPSSYDENALVVRVCCMIALGQLLADYKETTDTTSLAAAAILKSAHTYRPRSGDKFLAKAEAEFQSVLDETTEKAGAKVRERAEFSDLLTNLEELEEPADLSSFWNDVWPEVLEGLRSIDKDRLADREELQVLAWMTRAYSSFSRQPVELLSSSAAIIGCAIELGALVICPPNAAIRQFLGSMLVKNRKATELSKTTTLAKLIESIAPEVIDLLQYTEEETRFIDSWASFQPCNWILLRLKNSGNLTGWEREFCSRTGWQTSHRLSSYQWAEQIFLETITRRTLAEL